MAAALWTPPAQRRPSQRGRPRRRGVRWPTPAALAAACRHGQTVPVTLSGRALTTQVVGCRARWYVARRRQPVPSVLVRDPSGRRAAAACCSTDVVMDAVSVRAPDGRRWTLAVTFHDAQPSRGVADPQNQSAQAVRQTAPGACLVYGLVLLWSAARVQAGAPRRWVQRPWYPTRATPSFADMLTALRVAGWRRSISDPPSLPRRHQESATPWPDAVLATA